MNNFIITHIFSLVIVSLSAHAQTTEDRYLRWDKNRKLRFTDFQQNREDFKGDTDLTRTYSISKMDIYIDTQNEGDSISYVIFSYLDRRESFMFDNDSVGLNSTQIVFNMYELYARKLKYYICTKKSITLSEINYFHNKIIYELNNEYSQLSWNKNEMEKFNMQILTRINTMSKYANTEGKVKLKK